MTHAQQSQSGLHIKNKLKKGKGGIRKPVQQLSQSSKNYVARSKVVSVVTVKISQILMEEK